MLSYWDYTWFCIARKAYHVFSKFGIAINTFLKKLFIRLLYLCTHNGHFWPSKHHKYIY